MPHKRRARRGSRPPKITPIKRGPKKNWRYRAQVYDPTARDGIGQYVSVCTVLNMSAQTFTIDDVDEYVQRAEELLGRRGSNVYTVTQIRKLWLGRKVDVNGRQIKQSTHDTNEERTKHFVERFGDDVPVGAIADAMLKFARTRYPGSREALKAMFNYAVEEELVHENPLRRLKVQKPRGNREVFPPRKVELQKLLGTARDIGCLIVDWIEFATEVGTRPGETDGLRIGDFNADFSRVQILRQYNTRSKCITLPKQVAEHWIAVSPRASAIAQLHAIGKRPTDYLFVNTRGNHWTSQARAYHWNALMQAAGFRRRDVEGRLVNDFTPYLATRHYCGWTLVNIHGATEAEVAHQLRHHDGGELVRKIYGKRDRVMAIDRIAHLLRADDPEALAA